MPKEIPEAKPGDLKTKRLIEKVQEAKAKGEDSILGKMWAYRGLDRAPYNIFDFRISRHRDGPMTSSATVSASYKEIVFREIHR